ncbi:MAG: hypothetical protein ACYC91_14550 [Solirubrobacteraceae bacterium]
MPGTHPNPKLRGQIEAALHVVAPVLDLLLAVGDRVSRVLARDGEDGALARLPHEGESAPRGLRPRAESSPRN